MKRLLRIAVCGVVLAAAAQEKSGEGGEESLQFWKWANFIVLAGALGYLIGKKAPPFFAERSRSIRKEIIEADEARKEAEARAAAVEQRMAHLEAEIAQLRQEAHDEGRAETERLMQHTAAEMAKIQAHAEQEIAAAAKAARLDLKRHAADLAIDLAEQKIRARMTPATQDALVRGFVRDLQ